MKMILAKRNVRIHKLEIEKMELKSKLDKFHSIFPSSLPEVGGGVATTNYGGVAKDGWQATPSITTFLRCGHCQQISGNIRWVAKPGKLSRIDNNKVPRIQKKITFDR